MFYSMVIHIVSRSGLTILAKQEAERIPGEEELAALPVGPSRDLDVSRIAFWASLSVIKERGPIRWISGVALVYLGSLSVFVASLLASGFVPLFIALACRA